MAETSTSQSGAEILNTLVLRISPEQETALNQQTAEAMHRRSFRTVTGGANGSPTEEGYRNTRYGTLASCGTQDIHGVSYDVGLVSSQSELAENLPQHSTGSDQSEIWKEVPVDLGVALRHPLTGSEITLPLAKVHTHVIEWPEFDESNRITGWRTLDITNSGDQGAFITIDQAISFLDQAQVR